jgi:hypothetical protein
VRLIPVYGPGVAHPDVGASPEVKEHEGHEGPPVMVRDDWQWKGAKG